MLLMTIDGRCASSRSRRPRTVAALIISAWLKSPTRGDGWGEVSTYGALPGAGVTRFLQSSSGCNPDFPRETALEEAALEVEDELAGESDRADASSSGS